jgi:hypothetical protein
MLKTGDDRFDALVEAWTRTPEKAIPLISAPVRRAFVQLSDRFPGISMSVFRKDLVLVNPGLIQKESHLVVFVLESLDFVQHFLRRSISS